MYSKSAKNVGIYLECVSQWFVKKKKKEKKEVGNMGVGKFNYYQILLFFAPHTLTYRVHSLTATYS